MGRATLLQLNRGVLLLETYSEVVVFDVFVVPLGGRHLSVNQVLAGHVQDCRRGRPVFGSVFTVLLGGG